MEWEGLDVEDTFLRPCNSNSNSNDTDLIPGPAGAVQAAMNMMKRSRRGHPLHLPLPTQDQNLIRRVVQNGHDHDFTSNPWLSALQFLHHQGIVASDSTTPLNSITNHLNSGRVPQVLAVIKSCTPNGFGDMMVTLKDPTSTVGASVHHKVFADGNFRKDITVGSVLLLQKVAVFSPTRSACYLNITLSNIVKVFSKDSAPPSQQIYPAHSVRRATPGIAESHERSWMLGSTLTLPQERTEGIMSNLKLDSRFREVADTDKQEGEILGLTSFNSDNGNDGNQNTDLDRVNISLRQDNARPVEITCGVELEKEMQDQPKRPKFGEGDNSACSDQGNSRSTNSVQISYGQESGKTNHLERRKEIVNPKSSMPHWTDEQLDELLAFD